MPDPIYTRKGDRGETHNLAGKTIKKKSIDARALGTIDELNAAMGMARASCVQAEIAETLLGYQRKLFRIGSAIASYPDFHNHDVTADDVTGMEAVIDRWTDEMPPLQSFLLPGASVPEASLHVARTVCRRAERELNDWLHAKLEQGQPSEKVGAALVDALSFMNRLSDLLFTAARLANHRAGVDDDRIG
jgi:cob(I)alamin adenosyltransferase